MSEKELNTCGCGCNESEEKECGCGHNHEHEHECGCGHNHEIEEETLVVDLEDEEGNIVTCDIVDVFEYKDSQYVLVQHPEEESLYLLKADDSEEGALFVPEEAEFEEVTAYYKEMVEKEEN